MSDGDGTARALALEGDAEVPQRGPKPSEFLAPERHVELARRLRGAGADDHLGEGIRDVAVTLLDAEGGHVHHALVVQLVLVLGLDGVPESVGELGEGVSGDDSP